MSVPVSDRQDALDGLRGLAILSIIVLHYLVYPVMRAQPHWYSAGVGTVGRHLWSGVDLFFVLSGYLIASGLLKDRLKDGYFTRFFVRRSFRILPLYAILLGAFLLLSALAIPQLKSSGLLAHPFPVAAYATFTQNLFLGLTGNYGGDLMAATWSLAIEVQFYLLIPVLCRFLSERSLLIACGAMIATSVLTRMLLPYPSSYAYPFCRADGLFMGVAIAVFWNGPQKAAALSFVSHHWLLGSAAAIAAYAGVALAMPNAGGALNHLFFATAYSVLLLTVLTFDTGQIANIFHQGWLVWLGKMSYGLYLFHYGVLSAVFLFAQHREPTINAAGDFALIGASLLLSLALVRGLHALVEAPMIVIGRRMAGQIDAGLAQRSLRPSA